MKDGRATGVLVRIEGHGSSEISAREIVLCAGAIHSPAILLRSGIGPADQLKAMGIAVERDLPVGKHFSTTRCFAPPYSCAKNFGRATRIRVILTAA